MGIYIGFIEKKGYEPTIFFNFKPIAEVKESQIVPLSPVEQGELLPESEKRNINFTFSWDDQEDRQQMDFIFADKSLVIFEFSLTDLQPNIKNTGERNQTGYKVQAIEMINTYKIRPIDMDCLYYVIRKEELLSNFINDTIVEIDSSYLLAGNKVFVELDNFWAGPYEVGYRDYTSSYYIKPQIKEKKYTITGYKPNSVTLQELTSTDGYWDAIETKWTILMPKENAAIEQLDVISNETLIESFRDSIQNSMTNKGKVSLDDIPSLLKHYDESILTGSVLTEEVRYARLNRLSDILTSEEDIDGTLKNVTNFVCDLLIKYQDNDNVEEWLQVLLQKHPELINQLKESRTISEQIAQMEQRLLDLKQQHNILENKIEENKQKAETINQAAIQAKKEQLLKMDAEYAKLSKHLESIKDHLQIGESITELQKKYNEIQGEVDYLEKHKRHLEKVTDGLEFQYEKLIRQSHEKMVNIAFDGFMANKILNAASQWEIEESAQQHESLIIDVNSIPINEKTTDELIDYLCRTIQIVRPNYNKNTIVNIAICLTQGFLTVFSGEPGCGKTSICNILGEVLGLNKIPTYVNYGTEISDNIKRYVPVSVEKGWTSKRDFIGYFNPLSKTFDKSNRRVYDAIYQLSTEKRKGINKLPYIILLDEANLSPMEYYWSDFMNIGDNPRHQCEINLGGEYIFDIPETLHFIATINNDHTTEALSPRLIDRAWIISLPQQYTSSIYEEIPADQIEIIPWKTLYEAFVPHRSECILSAEVQKIYDTIVAKLKERRIPISPRVDKAIKCYWASAAKLFEMDETKTDAKTVALDYAVAQRILPKIMGNGESFEKWLEEFRSLCSNQGLNMSAKLLKDIIDSGNQQMKYYQFFC